MDDDSGKAEATIPVEVAYATPGKQLIVALQVPLGTTAHEAIAMSNIADEFPAINLSEDPVGIFSKTLDGKTRPTARGYVLQSHDRVEIYRPLTLDPKQARRQRALAAQEKAQGKAKE